MRRKTQNGFEKRPQRRFSFKRIAVSSLIVILFSLFFGLPIALQNRGLIVTFLNRNAGLAPIRIDLSAIEVGWIRPIKLRGVRLIDEHGAELIKVSELETELTLWRLVTDMRNLRTMTVRGVEVQLDVQPGTTNIEQALKPFLANDPASSVVSHSTPATLSPFAGRIRVEDAVVHARDSVDLSNWDLAIKQADIPLPTREQAIPPMTLVGTLQQTQAQPGEVLMGGQFSIQTQAIGQAITGTTTSDLLPMKMTISTSGLPLHWFNLVKRRMPDIPIERLLGLATVQAEVELHNDNHMLAQIQTAQLDSIQLHAPLWLGPRGAAIQQLRLSGKVQRSQDRVRTEGLTLQSDVGTMSMVVDMPFPPSMPTLAQPWILNSDYEINGAVDLARLIQIAPDLVQMQDQVQLTSGQAKLVAVQRRTDPVNAPTSNFQLSLGGLQANMRGTNMRWDQALEATVDLKPGPGGQPSFKTNCISEFCTIRGQGDLVQGQMAGSFDLDKMQQRLSQWFALPVESLTGSAECQVAWKQDETNRLLANGALKTTPVKIVNKYGQLNEPAWEGDFRMIGRIDKGSLIQIDRAEANLVGSAEQLSIIVQEPVSLLAATPGMAQLPPAGITIKMTGDLAGWQRRGQLFAGVDPGVYLGGNCNLEAKGMIDASHMELTSASMSTKDFLVQSGATKFSEPDLVATFKGRVDTKDIARLQVDDLLVRTLSFAIQANDEAASGPGLGRVGRAAFRINPQQLIASLEGVLPPDANLSVEGEVTGQARWQLDTKQIAWALAADAQGVRAFQQTTAEPGTAKLVSTGTVSQGKDLIWEESLARLTAAGRYDLTNGRLEIPESQLLTDWIGYAGNAVLATTKEQTAVVAKGNVTYNAARVADKLRPWIGSSISIQGERTQPLEVTWTSNQKNGTWADALQAKSVVGWDGANAVGIPIGKSDFPITIENGHFLSKAEIPVSQGKLRWNLDGNLAATPMTVVQSPEMVLENVAITPQMCQGWLKYVAPLLADVTSVQGNLSLKIDEAKIYPMDMKRQTVKGELTVHGANVGPGPLADQLLGLVQQVRNFRKGLGAADGNPQSSTSWLQMPEQKVGFDVQQGRIAHKNMQIQAGDIVLSTSGTVGVDGSLELIASVPIQREWVEKTASLQSLAGQPLQVPIRGTVQRPQLDYSAFTSMAQQVGSAALRYEAQKQIDKGMNKLLGPLSNQLGPLQQGVQQMQQNLPQLPLPNLQNLQIPGFGNGGPFGGGTPPPTVPPQPQP